MSKKIVIVESPSKSKTIEKYLGSDYIVTSSKGHVRDLATSGKEGLGVDVENQFLPKYVINKDKKDVVKELKELVKESDEVYLATDPDREGEAISWHLAQVLNVDMDKENRVVFNEVTKDAVVNALQHPRKIDQNLVKSQETRRVLDRIIGFKLSKLLQKKIKSKSAGRVQSVALRLIVEKEREIEAFVPQEYWKIKAEFEKDEIEFTGELAKYNNAKLEIKNGEEANQIYESLNKEFEVNSVKKTTKKRESKLPFITSTLQQEASSKLGYKAKKTMSIAQKLYEGIALEDETVGLITYMRTDSTRLSEVFVKSAHEYIEKKYGKDYVGKVKVSKKTENVQDAHEGIRPTSALRTPESVKEFLKPDEYKLYSLIYARAMASLMAPAKFDATSVSLMNNGYEFKVTGSVMKFDGYLRVYGKYEKQNNELLPELKEKEMLESKKVEKTQHFTKPPARYSEAKLIKEMEELGIGRPSTYAMIIDTIQTRGYVELVDKAFKPTETGILTSDRLTQYFNDIINVEYTAKMEHELDEIAEGEDDYVSALQSFMDVFQPLLDDAYDKMEVVAPKKTGEKCPECGHDLVERRGRYGLFVACENYPECKYIKKDPVEVEYTGEECPKCGGEMVYKNGRFGRFEACSNYPECKYIKNSKKKEPVMTDEVCPNCGSPVVIKQGRWGEFKACSNYPKCKTIIK
ncbi:MAG: type I DNA topoisomerase [[Clostridium] spiroforme]|uniref:DNA topoisomerase 1 n=1 Tax=Thomasclavelia spiroformis TaxID=29348 RepID=A0A943EJG5_9FIRM|nr:type I DNA topoisomerase [Thomasclavelia spiroformis]MBS5587551.1 type I DNA topoisomerase [Thomasclavelia spiroformis]